jgi:hypothetical protein
MEKMSTKLCNNMLDTGSLKGSFTNMELRLYAGSVPATADAAAGSTAVIVVKNGGSYATFGTASGGTIAINSTETWTGTAGSTTTITFYRLVGHADDDSSDSGHIYPRVQGTIGVGGSDMNVGSAAVTSGASFTVNTFTQSIVPS